MAGLSVIILIAVFGFYTYNKKNEDIGGACMVLAGIGLIMWSVYWLTIFYTTSTGN